MFFIFRRGLLPKFLEVLIRFSLFGLSLSAFVHPFYVSLTQIEHNIQNKSLEISVRIFADDLQKALQQYQKTVKIYTNKNQLLTYYLQERLRMWVNGAWVNILFLGKEEDEEATWCYLEVKNIPFLKTVTIENQLLFNEFTSQVNMIHLKANNKIRSAALTRTQPRIFWELD
jgi:hypothetical protein